MLKIANCFYLHINRSTYRKFQHIYEQQFQFEMLNEDDHSVDEKHISCSPGISDIFTTFNTINDMVSINIESAPSSPKLKSILKKTPNKTQIIRSPASAAIRRTKSQLCRRSSARRELRFGPDTKKSPKSPTISLISPAKKHSRSFQLRKLFRCNMSMAITKDKPENFITSTPINFLDDDDFGAVVSKKKWNSPAPSHLPLFYGSEKFQCGNCKETWENNRDLILHVETHHKGVRHWLRPQYRCGVCKMKFYSNKYLVRHCHLQHTPTTKRRL